MFLAQSWLIAVGEYHRLAEFGTHFLFAVLGMTLVDAGSITTLARRAAFSSGGATARQALWKAFSDTMAFRMLLAAVLVVVAAVYAFSPAADGYSRSYVLFMAPGFLFFACNAAGLLDGFKLSGISGISSAFPYAISALLLVLSRHASPEAAGALLGAAFSAGCLLTVALQWAALARIGWRPRRQATTARGIWTAAREGGAMLGVMLPSQIYGRAQLLFSATYLGAETTALFIYAKQAVVAAIQITAFVQRVEFPTLVKRLSAPDENVFRTIFSSQKLMAAAGMVATVGMFAAGLVAAQWPESRFSAVAPFLSAFSPIILTMTALLMTTQALAATGAFEGLALDYVILSSIGLVVSFVLLSRLGAYAFVVGDVFSNLCGFVLMLLRLGRSKPNVVAAVGRL